MKSEMVIGPSGHLIVGINPVKSLDSAPPFAEYYDGKLFIENRDEKFEFSIAEESFLSAIHEKEHIVVTYVIDGEPAFNNAPISIL